MEDNEVYEECPYCDTEGCGWCDNVGFVKHDCGEETSIMYEEDYERSEN